MTPARGVRASLVLRSLDDVKSLERFDTFKTESMARAAHGELYPSCSRSKGAGQKRRVTPSMQLTRLVIRRGAGAFEGRGRQIFELRREILETFSYDWLLRRLDREGMSLVLGLYGDEEGATRLCREHPRIQSFIRANPAINFSATDLTGMRCFRVEHATALS